MKKTIINIICMLVIFISYFLCVYKITPFYEEKKNTEIQKELEDINIIENIKKAIQFALENDDKARNEMQNSKALQTNGYYVEIMGENGDIDFSELENHKNTLYKSVVDKISIYTNFKSDTVKQNNFYLMLTIDRDLNVNVGIKRWDYTVLKCKYFDDLFER